MKQLQYWLLARLPRPVVVIIVWGLQLISRIISFAYWSTVSICILITVFALSGWTVDNLHLRSVFAYQAVFLGFLIVYSMAYAVIGIIIYDSFIVDIDSRLHQHYTNIDNSLPKRDKKDES